MPKKKNLNRLPKLKDSISFLYLEHVKIEQDYMSITAFDSNGETDIPIANITTIFLGPGVNITSAAIKTIADCGCSIVWCGEGMTRFYAFGKGETRSGKNTLKQAKLCMDDQLHMEVVRKMYIIRFQNPDNIPEEANLNQLRGIEGQRVRNAYLAASRIYGIPWYGREIHDDNIDESDPVNKALTIANQYLYGVCHSAIISLGYSPALGFIHTGRSESFVYDIADLYKAEISIPIAFKIAKENAEDINKAVRMECRNMFYQSKLLKRIPEDIATIFNVKIDDKDLNPASKLWDDTKGTVDGSINYSS